MGGGVSKPHTSTITIDTSNPNEQANITIDGCFHNHPVAIILKSPVKKRVSVSKRTCTSPTIVHVPKPVAVKPAVKPVVTKRVSV